MAIPPPPEIHIAGEVNSNALVPTHVWGEGSEALAAKWGAKWSTGSFAVFRKTFHRDKPLVLAISGKGPYTNQDWFLGDRPNQDVYIIGLTFPTLRGDGFSLSNFGQWYLKGLDLSACGLTSQTYRDDGPTTIYITQCTLRDTAGDQNGVGTPDDAAQDYPFTFYLWDSTLSQLGSRGNTRHALYIHGRPHGSIWINNIRAYGSKGCSIIKSTCVNNYVGNSYLSTVQDEQNISVGLKSSILVDIPADSDTVVEDNEFVLYRGPASSIAGELGLDSGGICWRPRREFHASDRPVYLSPEWRDQTFWTDRATPFLKKLRRNKFRLLTTPDSRPTVAWNAQGTHPRRAKNEFGKSIIEGLAECYHVWWERDWTEDDHNTYEGFPVGYQPWALMSSEAVDHIEPMVQWGGAPKYQRTVPSRRIAVP